MKTLSVNQRFTFAPAAITYPNNAQDVSTILKVAQQYDQKVAARSGGVRRPFLIPIAQSLSANRQENV